MAHLYHADRVKYHQKQSSVPEFAWHTSERLAELAGSKHFTFDIRSLDPGKYSFPYHFHRNAEELFVILEGSAMLRTPEGHQEVHTGDIVFFEMGPSGAHQLFNHTEKPCKYLDIRTNMGLDVCEYPDSGKINILPYQEVYESAGQVDYFKGEDQVAAKWAAKENGNEHE